MKLTNFLIPILILAFAVSQNHGFGIFSKLKYLKLFKYCWLFNSPELCDFHDDGENSVGGSKPGLVIATATGSIGISSSALGTNTATVTITKPMVTPLGAPAFTPMTSKPTAPAMPVLTPPTAKPTTLPSNAQGTPSTLVPATAEPATTSSIAQTTTTTSTVAATPSTPNTSPSTSTPSSATPLMSTPSPAMSSSSSTATPSTTAFPSANLPSTASPSIAVPSANMPSIDMSSDASSDISPSHINVINPPLIANSTTAATATTETSNISSTMVPPQEPSHSKCPSSNTKITFYNLFHISSKFKDTEMFTDDETHNRSLEKFCSMDGFKCKTDDDCFFGRKCCKVKFRKHSINNQHFGPFTHACTICIFV